MNKNKEIQRLAFVDPKGRNQKEIKKIINKTIDLIFKKISNAEKFPPLIKNKKVFKNFNLNDLPISEKEIFKKIKKIINYSMNSSNPNYLGHMDSLPTTMSIIGDLISSSLNNNMLSKETAPVLTEIENSVIESFAKKFKLGNQSGGVMLAGGSLSNLQAIGIARNRFFESFEKGLTGLKRQPYIFTSEYCHTSIQKAAMILGLGTNSVVLVPTDSNGKMITSALRKLIQDKINNNGNPFCIVATAGTTITGSIDPLNEIAKIAEKYKMWMHTDSVYGGALIFSEKFKYKLNGIEKSNSISFNPQKWLYITKTCSMLLLKNKNYLYSDFFIPLPYVTRNKDDFNSGEVSVQGTRYPDILKLWLSFQHLGRITYSNLINNSCNLTENFKSEIIKRKFLKLACNPEMNIFCFRAEPKNINYNDYNIWNIKLRDFLLKKHNIFFSICEFKGCNWLRAVVLNPFISNQHIHRIFKGIDEFNKNEKQNKKAL